MERDLDDPTPAGMAAAVDHAVAAIEIVDSRIADWKISFADTVADNGSSAFIPKAYAEASAALANVDAKTPASECSLLELQT